MRLLFALVVSSVIPVSAAAQEIPDWTTRVPQGKTLFVATTTGELIEGPAGAPTQAGLPVGARTIPFNEIRKVEKRDPTWHGLAIGAGAGLALGFALTSGECDDVSLGGACDDVQSGARIAAPLAGALVGWAFDAAIRRRSTIYNGSAASVSLSIAPGAAAVAIRW